MAVKLTTTQKIATNTIFQIFGKSISMLITVFATMLITHNYGKEGYGAFSLMQGFPALFFIIVDFGLNAIAVRELSQKWENAPRYLGNIFIIRVFLSTIFIAFLAFLLLFFPYSKELRFGIYMSLFLILTQALYATTNIIFQVKLRYDLSTLGYVLGSLVTLCLILLLVYLHASVVWLSFSYVAGGGIVFLINLFFVHKLLRKKIRFNFDGALWKHLFIQSFPLGLMFVFSQINFKADTLILSVHRLPFWIGLTNTESVAIYSLPYKVFEVCLVVPTFFMNSVYPVFVRHLAIGSVRLKNTFLRVISALFIGGLFFGFVGVLCAPLIITILGGASFEQSVLVLRILLMGLVLFYISQPLSWLLVTLGSQKYLPMIYFVSALFNVSTNLIFIPKYSFYGSSVITLLSEVIILILLTFAVKKAWVSKYVA